jgi:hypothetical protein
MTKNKPVNKSINKSKAKSTNKSKSVPAPASVSEDMTVSDNPNSSDIVANSPKKSKRQQRKAERQTVRKTKLTSGFKLLASSVKMMLAHWEVFGGILLVYAVLDLLLIGGFSGTSDLQTFKSNLSDVFTGQFSKLSTGLGLFAIVAANGASNSTAGNSGPYQVMLLIFISLVLVWAFRQYYAGSYIRVRDAFYQSMYPLTQVLLVLVTIGLELIPVSAALFMFKSLIQDNVVTILGWQILIVLACIVLVCVSIYFLCASLFALYIVTLPDMTPLAAVRSANNVVRYRRAAVLRKLILLVFILLIPSMIIMVPISVFVTALAIPVFFILTVAAVGVINGYLYALYRDLITE